MLSEVEPNGKCVLEVKPKNHKTALRLRMQTWYRRFYQLYESNLSVGQITKVYAWLDNNQMFRYENISDSAWIQLEQLAYDIQEGL